MSTVGVYIGRFQPFHNGHKSVVDRMLRENDDNIILLGGANQPRSRDNPFSPEERAEMLELNYSDDDRFIVSYLDDNPDDNVWATSAKFKVANMWASEVRLYGAHSDASSFYLDLFPEWEKRLETLVGYHVHATTIRLWLRNRDWTHIEQNVPPGAFAYLKRLVEEEPDTCHKWLRNTHEFASSN